MIKAHVVGVDALLRNFDRKKKEIEDALSEGCDEAAEYAMEMIGDKFGRYQPGWKQLKPETVRKKGSDEPLIDTADMMFSFEKKTSNRTRKHTVTITSDDPKLPYHMYGAPNANVPRRDPVRPTLKEEKENCLKIIHDKVKEVLHRG